MPVVLIFVETNWPGSWFVMAVLGCRSLVLDKLEKNDAFWSNFLVKDFNDTSLKDYIRRVGGMYQDDILKDDSTYVALSY